MSEKRVNKIEWSKPKKYKKNNNFYQDDDDDDFSGIKMIRIPTGNPIPQMKTPNLWELTTNFRITDILVEKIQDVDGVEALFVSTPYIMNIGIGSLFDQDEVRIDIQNVIKELVI